MKTCFICGAELSSENDAELEGVDICIDCVDKMDAVVRDYLTSRPGGLDLVVDIVSEELKDENSGLRKIIHDIVSETKKA